MAIAKAQITISRIIDIDKVIRYYLLQSSTSAVPDKPTTNPPPDEWTTIEPSYTSGSTNTLYFVDLTIFTNDTFSYSDVSKSSSYEAAKEAYNNADAAHKRLTIAETAIEQTNEAIELKATEENVRASIQEINDALTNISKSVEAKIDSDGLNLSIQETLSNGINSVTTTNGYSFTDEGLKVTKSDSDIITTITENGMMISKDDSDVLVANENGVIAKDLSASTYLIIGGRSRFENYKTDRTGCFWIGG